MAIKTNTQVVLRFNLKWGNGAPIDLRRHTGARCTLVMPDDTTAAITDLGYDRLTNQIWVRIAGTHNSQIGSYKANLAVMTQNLQMVTTGIVKVYDVAADGEDYKLVTLSLTVTSIDTPVNIGQGYSPKIVNGEWVVFDDSQQAYVPTGQSVVATEYVDEAVAAEAEARQQDVQSLETSLSSEVSRAQAKEADIVNAQMMRAGVTYERTEECSTTKNYKAEFLVNIPAGSKFKVTLTGDAVFTNANVFYNDMNHEIGRINVDGLTKAFTAPTIITKIIVFRSCAQVASTGTVKSTLDVNGSIGDAIDSIGDNTELVLSNSKDFNVYELTNGQGQFTDKYSCCYKKDTIIQVRNEQESTLITRLRTYDKDRTTRLDDISVNIKIGSAVNITLNHDIYYYDLYIGGSNTNRLKYSIVEIGTINELIANSSKEIDKINCYYTYNDVVKSVNHMGHKSCPENTLVAIRISRANGFKYVENDIRFTQDGIPVMIHDATLNRTARNSDGTALASDVYIADLTLAQAKTYDVGLYKGEEFRGEQIPTLEEYLATCRTIGLYPYLEIKVNDETQAVEVARIANRYGFRGSVTFISFNYDVLSAISEYDNTARLGYLLDRVNQDGIANIKQLQENGNDVFADVNKTGVSSSVIETLAENRIKLEIWVVDDNSGSIGYLKELDPYVTGVTTNRWVAGKFISE